MNKFIERFNAFDLFTMLIPGIGICTLLGISFAYKYYSIWEKWGNEKYVIFFIFSYFCGVIFQELGTILDRYFLYNKLYGGNPREIFLLENGHEKIFNEELFYKNVRDIKDYFINYLFNDNKNEQSGLGTKDYKNISDTDLSSLIFGYCLNIAENNNLAGKSEKMLVISEMSRSMFWGCIATIIINCFMIFIDPCNCIFYFIEIIILFFLAKIFLTRKKRYEKYRIRILLRTIYLYIKENEHQNTKK